MGTIDNLRRLVAETDAVERPYECLGCGQQYAHRRQVCPRCNGFSIERLEW
jgi:lipopolysaccharide biosynthesis regulator YciM